METFRERLRLAMKQSGFTQQALADRVGVTQTAIGKLIRGEATNSRYLVQIAAALKVTPEWLLTGDGGERKEVSCNEIKEPAQSIYSVLSAFDQQLIALANGLTKSQKTALIRQLESQNAENDLFYTELSEIKNST